MGIVKAAGALALTPSGTPSRQRSVGQDKMAPVLHVFEDVVAWQRGIADGVGTCLARAGTDALIALPGGSTPEAFLPAVADTLPHWQGVTVTLTDDRRVPIYDPRSNAGMVQRRLLASLQKQPTFLPPLNDAGAESSAAGPLPSRRFDLIILGLGNDGHVASLFPGSATLDDDGSTWMPVEDAPDGVARISLPMASLINATSVLLAVRGDAKRSLIDSCLVGRMPMAVPLARLLAGRRAETAIHWSP